MLCPVSWELILYPGHRTQLGLISTVSLPLISNHGPTKWLTEGVTDDPARRASESPEKGMVEHGAAEATPPGNAAIPEA